MIIISSRLVHAQHNSIYALCMMFRRIDDQGEGLNIQNYNAEHVRVSGPSVVVPFCLERGCISYVATAVVVVGP